MNPSDTLREKRIYFFQIVGNSIIFFDLKENRVCQCAQYACYHRVQPGMLWYIPTADPVCSVRGANLLRMTIMKAKLHVNCDVTHRKGVIMSQAIVERHICVHVCMYCILLAHL